MIYGNHYEKMKNRQTDQVNLIFNENDRGKNQPNKQSINNYPFKLIHKSRSKARYSSIRKNIKINEEIEKKREKYVETRNQIENINPTEIYYVI